MTTSKSVDILNSKISNLQHPSTVDHTVGGLQTSMSFDKRTVKVFHSLREQNV